MIEPEAPAPQTTQPVQSRLGRTMSRDFARDMFVSGILPWISVFVLQHYGVTIVRALAISTIFPIADGAYSLIRRHRLDGIGTINICFLLASIVVTFISGDVHVLLLKGAVLTGVFSLVCLGSLLAPKPLMFFLGRQMSTRDDPVLLARWNARWEFPQFRNIIRLITAVWGIGYALEVVGRVITAYTLPPLTVIALAPFITYGVLALLIVWTIAYSNAMERKYEGAGNVTAAAGTDSP
jgi:hypothetical protein